MDKGAVKKFFSLKKNNVLEQHVSINTIRINNDDSNCYYVVYVMKTYGNWWRERVSRRVEYMPQNNPSIVSHDFIEVAFETAVYPRKIHLYEIFSGGAVVRIWALPDQSYNGGEWVLLWEGPPKKVEPRKFNPPINCVHFKTNSLRIELNTSLLDYYAGIAAVDLFGETEERKSRRGSAFNAFTQQLPCLKSIFRDSDTNASSVTNEDVQPALTLESLPCEIILKILGYLDLRSLCSVAQVSRTLNELATDDCLFIGLSLRPYWSTLGDAQLLSLGQRCRRLERLDLSWCSRIDPVVFMRFVSERCSGLTHIRLDCCKFVFNGSIQQLAETCTGLRELSLRNCLGIAESGFRHMTVFTRLTSLDLHRSNITGDYLIPILKANEHLQHLKIGYCSRVGNMDEVAQTLGSYNRRLLSLDMQGTSPLGEAGVIALSQCSQLQEINLGCLRLSQDSDCLITLAWGCRQLRQLFLRSVCGVYDKDLEQLPTACPGLEQIELILNKDITPKVISHLLKNLSQLRLLDISRCVQLDPMVDTWRRIFPHVAIKYKVEPATSPEFLS